MSHHYPKSVVEAAAWCATCGKNTPHFVWDGRLGRCKNEHPHLEPAKTEETQYSLFLEPRRKEK